MAQKKMKKLVLNKNEVVKLNSSEQRELKGEIPTIDIPTVGHGDGSWCLSKTDWGWCWCYGS